MITMNRSEHDTILLDQKIARIREQNEKIMRRKQEIDDEIARENQWKQTHNNSVGKHRVEHDYEKPTLYSDVFESKKEQPLSEDAVWRAERDQIDRERILRQKSNNGWKREWDAHKKDEQHFASRSSFARANISKDGWRTKSHNNTWDRSAKTDFAPRRRENEGNSVSRRVENNQIFMQRRNDTAGVDNRNRYSNDDDDDGYTKCQPQGSFRKSDRFSNDHESNSNSNSKQRRIRNSNNADSTSTSTSTTDWMKQKNFAINVKQPSRGANTSMSANAAHGTRTSSNRWRPTVEQHSPRKCDAGSGVGDGSEIANLTDGLKNITIICDSAVRGKRLAVLSTESSLPPTDSDSARNSKLEPFDESLVETIRQCVTDLSNCEISKARITESTSVKSETSASSRNTADQLGQLHRQQAHPKRVDESSTCRSDVAVDETNRRVRTPQITTTYHHVDATTVDDVDDNDDEWEDMSTSSADE